jgi:chemotaxis regulatin CheY-phosphate phosphatase CheZ
MNAPTGKIDPMAIIKNVMLITVATEITEAFEKKDSKKLAGIMVRECVQRGESFLSQVPQDTMEEAKEFYEIIARIYSTMALKA